jgi:hypothetical protein
LNQGKILTTSGTNAESSSTNAAFDYNEGFFLGTAAGTGFAHMFRRAPGFFDVVCRDGSNDNTVVNHNLGVVPELVITKRRDVSNEWYVAHSFDGTSFKRNFLESNLAASTINYTANFYFIAPPTETTYTLDGGNANYNTSGGKYIDYLFATLPGVSKVGSYTGNGTSQTIDCGFTSGARFILIKRTDSTGDWYVWDTERGIVTGNDPHLSLNTTAAEVTSDDSIDPDSSGFIVNQVAATNINVSSASYIFYAIA